MNTLQINEIYSANGRKTTHLQQWQQNRENKKVPTSSTIMLKQVQVAFKIDKLLFIFRFFLGLIRPRARVMNEINSACPSNMHMNRMEINFIALNMV